MNSLYNSISKNQTTWLKMGWSFQIDIFFQSYIDDQQARENIFNTANHQGNVNPNYNVITSHPFRMVTVKKTRNRKCPHGCGEKGTIVHSCWQCKLLWKTVWKCLKKLKVELLYNPLILVLDIYPKKTKTLIGKDIHTRAFTAALFTIVKRGKQHKCPSAGEYIKKMWYTYIMGYYSAIKKMKFCHLNSTDGHRGCYS